MDEYRAAMDDLAAKATIRKNAHQAFAVADQDWTDAMIRVNKALETEAEKLDAVKTEATTAPVLPTQSGQQS